jgi:LmbE family N-acetylglucosaminyl deacetylase
MNESLKLMCVFAHPDDETLGTGSTLAKYAAEGVEVYVVTATRGERGWSGDEKDFPGLEAMGKIREQELRCAAQTLGVRKVEFLDYIDGDLDQANPAEAIGKITRFIRQYQPQVVITFPPDGTYGHPDHIAICQYTSAALVCAADPNYAGQDHLPTHRVSKLYYMVDSQELFDAYFGLFGDIRMIIDGVERQGVVWHDWAITTRINGEPHWPVTWQAVNCHKSQLPGFGDMSRITKDQHRRLWGERTYYRAYSLVNSGRKVETDLFSGLR